MIQKIWQTLGGRKFIAFVAATVLLVTKFISDDIWLFTFITYCAANVLKSVMTVKKG